MSQSDYEDDAKRKLNITDPYGVNTKVEQAKCSICGAPCVVANATCKGEVNMMSDMHLCDEHKKEKHGAPNNWYSSEPSEKELIQREIGSKLNEI